MPRSFRYCATVPVASSARYHVCSVSTDSPKNFLLSCPSTIFSRTFSGFESTSSEFERISRSASTSSAGTGNPYFTTDTAAALRALEIGAEAILMAKNGVEGVMDGDPREHPDAKLIPALTHLQAIERGLKVMDTTALSLCMDNRLPIHVFELTPGNVGRVASGERVGTIISTPEGESR